MLWPQTCRRGTVNQPPGQRSQSRSVLAQAASRLITTIPPTGGVDKAREKALSQTLASWLNSAKGATDADEIVTANSGEASVGVFLTFTLGRSVGTRQMGLGLGVAVLIDATLIRTVLLPASMKLLGDRKWYFPTWLEWLPNLSSSEVGEGRQVPSEAVPAMAGD